MPTPRTRDRPYKSKITIFSVQIINQKTRQKVRDKISPSPSVIFRHICTKWHIYQERFFCRPTYQLYEFFLKPTQIYLCWLFYGEKNLSTVCHNCSQFDQKVKLYKVGISDGTDISVCLANTRPTTFGGDDSRHRADFI